eukprot:1414713-Alexandrium_andersonii.AAC.1
MAALSCDARSEVRRQSGEDGLECAVGTLVGLEWAEDHVRGITEVSTFEPVSMKVPRVRSAARQDLSG